MLFGKVNPSGKIPETFPVTHKDCSAHCVGEFPGGKTVSYKEGIFVGYRYYDTNHVPVLFPFGHGLSYTEFTYDKLKVAVEDENVLVSFTVTNTGELDGKEVAQIYVGMEHSEVERPTKELKAFEKVELKAKETKNVTLALPKEALAYYSEEQQKFVVEDGEYTIFVGKSVQDICLTEKVEIKK